MIIYDKEQVKVVIKLMHNDLPEYNRLVDVMFEYLVPPYHCGFQYGFNLCLDLKCHTIVSFEDWDVSTFKFRSTGTVEGYLQSHLYYAPRVKVIERWSRYFQYLKKAKELGFTFNQIDEMRDVIKSYVDEKRKTSVDDYLRKQVLLQLRRDE